MNWKRVSNDVNGNPRVVIHYLSLVPDLNLNFAVSLNEKYKIALERFNEIGGKKFNNKQFAGGVAFICYDQQELEGYIIKIINKHLNNF